MYFFGRMRKPLHTLLLKINFVSKGGYSFMTKFFAAANTEHGFRSLFPVCFSPEEHRRIYVLKGGPGTGKSTLMKNVGFAAEANGYEAEYFYCSSDTASLDGVRIPALGVAILDGTAPHRVDPVYPGAVERIVDLGEAFDDAGLEKKKREIVSLCGAKDEAYRTAYRYLAAAGRVAQEIDALLSPVFLSAKAEGAAVRLVNMLKRTETGVEARRYVSAIGTRGYAKLDTLQRKAKRICAVTERNGLEYLFMNKLYEVLSKENIAMTVCMTPLVSSHLEAIYIEGEDVLFAVMHEEEAQRADKIVNSARFVSREDLAARRTRLRFAERCVQLLLDGALSSLAEAGRSHAELERIYGQYVDFSIVDRIKNRMIAEIFANNM